MLLSKLHHQQKNALFAVIVQLLPVEHRPDILLENSSWSHEFLMFLVKEMNISESYYEAYSSLVDRHYVHDQGENDQKDLSMAPFLQVLQLQAVELHQDILQLVLCLMVTLILKDKYDSKARTMIRRLIFIMHTKLLIHESSIISITVFEEYLLYALGQQYNNSSQYRTITHSQNPKSNRSKYIRYAQIGVVSLTAGAAIALTGGLAAPAIAAAWGGLSFLTSAGVAATLFGSAGAGLAGYKMMKRTKGLTEFAFESSGDTKVNLSTCWSILKFHHRIVVATQGSTGGNDYNIRLYDR